MKIYWPDTIIVHSYLLRMMNFRFFLNFSQLELRGNFLTSSRSNEYVIEYRSLLYAQLIQTCDIIQEGKETGGNTFTRLIKRDNEIRWTLFSRYLFWEGITRSLFLSLLPPPPHSLFQLAKQFSSKNVRPPPLLVTSVHIKHFSFIETEPDMMRN